MNMYVTLIYQFRVFIVRVSCNHPNHATFVFVDDVVLDGAVAYIQTGRQIDSNVKSKKYKRVREPEQLDKTQTVCIELNMISVTKTEIKFL